MKYRSCDTIHETVIKDIVDVITDVKNTDEIKGFISGREKSFKSISSAAQNYTLVFPVICTRNMDIANASMVAKAIERKCVIMLQILFSAISYIDSNDIRDYISKYHTNVKLSNDFDLDEMLDIAEKIGTFDESAITKLQEKEIDDIMIEDYHRYSNNIAPSSISESSINDFKIINNGYGEDIIIHEAPINPNARYGDNDYVTRGEAIRRYNDLDTANADLRRRNINVSNVSINGGRGGHGGPPSRKDINDAYRKQIMDNDIKKSNELMPTTMVVHFNSINTSGTEFCEASALIGIKAKLYAAESSDILNHLASKYADTNFINKLVKATTREISFWRDLVFAIDKCKFDGISSASTNTSAKMWRVLERRSVKSRVKRTFGIKNDATAITTLVITQEEVEALKKNDNINVEQPAIVRRIMDSYNLMAFVIVDETNELAKFLFDDGDYHFEVYSFSALERESSDNGYKKIINLMTKMR